MTRTNTRFNLKFLRVFTKNFQHEKLPHRTIFHLKNKSGYFYWRYSPFPVAKWLHFSNLITCSRHYDILAKTRSRMTTAITFSRQNDVASQSGRALLSIEKISYEWSSSSQNLKLSIVRRKLILVTLGILRVNELSFHERKRGFPRS